MANIAYIRVSSDTQNTERQELLLKGLDIDKLYLEKASGKDIKRPELKNMLDYIREGDILYIESISRLGRNLKDLLEIVELLSEKGVGLISIKENFIDTTTPQGRLIFNIFATLAEFERENIKERQKEGIEIAKSKGIYKGRKKIKIEFDKNFEKLYKMWENKEITAVKFMDELNVKRNTFYRRIKEYEGYNS